MRDHKPLPPLPIEELARLLDRNPLAADRSAIADEVERHARGELTDAELTRVYQQRAPNNMRQRAPRWHAPRPPVADDGCFAKIGSAAYRDRDLNNSAGRLLPLLVQRAGKRRWWDGHIESLAAALAVHPCTAQRAVKLLEAKELIHVARCVGRGKRSRFTVLPRSLPPDFPSSTPRDRRRKGSNNAAVEPMPTASLSPCPSPDDGRGELDGAGRAEVGRPGAAERPSERCSEPAAADELPSRSRSAPSPLVRRALPRAARQGASASDFRARAGPAPRTRAPP